MSADRRSQAIATTSEASTVARLLWLKALFGGATPDGSAQPLDLLAERMTEFAVRKDDYLYEQGEPASGLYFIIEGTIEQGSTGYHQFVAGDVLGFVDAMMERPHAQTARVVEDAIVLRLSFDDWQDHLEQHPDVTRNLILSNARGISEAPDLPLVDEAHHEALLNSQGPQTASGEFVRSILAVRTTGFFQGASIQACAQLARRGDSHVLEEGQTRTSEELGLGMWVLIQGEVSFERRDGEKTHQYDCGPGSLLGSLHSASKIPDATVRATTSAEILCIASEVLFDVMEDHFDVARSAFRYLASHVEQYNGERDLEAEANAEKSST